MNDLFTLEPDRITYDLTRDFDLTDYAGRRVLRVALPFERVADLAADLYRRLGIRAQLVQVA